MTESASSLRLVSTTRDTDGGITAISEVAAALSAHTYRLITGLAANISAALDEALRVHLAL